MSEPKILEGIRDRVVPITVPKPYGKNPRRGDVERIAKSLEENGQYKTITLRRGTDEILAGNHTHKAAMLLGWSGIAVDHIGPITDDEAKQIVLVDNAANDWASYDLATRAELLASLPDPTFGTGYTAAELEAALNGVVQEPAPVPEDADLVPDKPAKPKTRKGDVWDLGPHRLICGDSQDPRVLEELLGSERPHLMWTDPPYGVDYVGKTKDAMTIEGDNKGGLRRLLEAAFTAAGDVLRPGAPVYVAHADTERITFEQALLVSGFLVRQNLIWVKNTMVLGHSDYHYRHEPILAAQQPGEPEPEPDDDDDNVVPIFTDGGPKQHSPIIYGFAGGGSGRLGRGGPNWWGPNNATTVFEFPKPPASREHPTMKPVGLILAHLANSLRKGRGFILDPFAGSGSTMMAADAHGAAARMVELDPAYCDVIAMRWQHHSGEAPLRNGKPVKFPARKE